MNDDHSVVPLARPPSKPQSVEDRIRRRIEVLEEWMENGVPAGKDIPQGLRAAREWQDDELRIAPIASPNEFTRTHDRHGHLVSAVSTLLDQLNYRYKYPKKNRIKPKERADDRRQMAHLQKQLESAVSQWHTERDAHLREKKRADAAEAHRSIIETESADKDKTIADLRRQIAANKTRFRIVE